MKGKVLRILLEIILIGILVSVVWKPVTVIGEGITNSMIYNKLLELEVKIDLLATQPSSTSNSTTETIPANTFYGQGKTQTLPFTINSTPWIINMEADMSVGGFTYVSVEILDPQLPEAAHQNHVGGYGFVIEGGENFRTTVTYLPAGTYYLFVDTPAYTTWKVWVEEL